jgi:hypothetical protein
LIILNPFRIQDRLETFEECSSKLLLLLSFDREVNDGTTGMKWFNNFVLVVTGEDESAVIIKCLNIRP